MEPPPPQDIIFMMQKFDIDFSQTLDINEIKMLLRELGGMHLYSEQEI